VCVRKKERERVRERELKQKRRRFPRGKNFERFFSRKVTIKKTNGFSKRYFSFIKTRQSRNQPDQFKS
jgi:hypothetical protein